MATEDKPQIMKSLHALQGAWREPEQAFQPDLPRRCSIAKETIKLSGPYQASCDSEVLDIPISVPERSYRETNSITETRIEVLESDVLDAAEKMLVQYKPSFHRHTSSSLVAVLNLADGEECCAGLAADSMSAEIEMCRRSTLFTALNALTYPLGARAVYTPQVAVLRSSAAEGYVTRPKPFHVAVVSAARPLDQGSNLEDYLAKLQISVESMLAIAASRRHSVLVFGPCGSWSKHTGAAAGTAQTLRGVLRSEPWRDRFRHIVFAVPEREGSEGAERACALLRAFHKECHREPSGG